jgi:hypothetical protein
VLHKPLVLLEWRRFPPSRQDERGSGFPTSTGPPAIRKHLPQFVPAHRLRARTAIYLHVFQQLSVFLVRRPSVPVLHRVGCRRSNRSGPAHPAPIKTYNQYTRLPFWYPTDGRTSSHPTLVWKFPPAAVDFLRPAIRSNHREDDRRIRSGRDCILGA